jgi:tight adherence protein C
MILFLLVGLVLGAVAVTLILRAATLSRVRVSESLGQIDAYGYESRALAIEEPPGSVQGFFNNLADTVGAFLTQRLASLREQEMREELRKAGFYQLSIRQFVGYRALAAVLVGGMWLWWVTIAGWPLVIGLLAAPVLALVGWQLPVIMIRNRGERRRDRVDEELPELIDLLVVTVEAGLGFNSSLQVASERFKGPLGEELRLTLQEQRMGLTTTESLRNLLTRQDTPGVRAFVRSILQGEQLGVSIGRVLRELAVDMRKRRRQRAEERAQKAPIKLLFPLIFLIFPAMFVVLLAPAVFAFLDAF